MTQTTGAASTAENALGAPGHSGSYAKIYAGLALLLLALILVAASTYSEPSVIEMPFSADYTAI